MAPDRIPTPHEAESGLAEAFRLIQTRAVDVLNAIDDGVFFLDPTGRAIFVNEAASRLLGFTNREGGPDAPRMLFYEREI